MITKNQTILLQSLEFANWAHRKQKRKIGDSPYIVHPFHVRWLLAMSGLDPENEDHLPIFIAGDNHDGPEDNPEEVTFELIVSKFGQEAARIVKGVTLNPNNPDKRLSRKKILGSDWKVRIVKVADITSNTMMTTSAIERIGLAEVQKYFKQPIHDRVVMEREFIDSVYQPDDQCDPLFKLKEFASAALKDLEPIAR